MASLSGVSGSNTLSSLMNSANMITGLASGLDTESMIESLVKSYQTKINQFNQKITKVEWKQEAYRSIISKMYNFANKYTSYTSNTNLMSPSFFSNAVKVLTKGAYADRVSASGKTSSDIRLDAVHQLATAAQYRTKSNLVSEDTGIISGKDVDLFSDDQIELSNLSGSMTLTYGSQKVSINFNEKTDAQAINDIRSKLANDRERAGDKTPVTDADVLAELINQKLADQKISFTGGGSESANQRIQATANKDRTITFSELGEGKNGVRISGASGNIAEQLGLKESDLNNAKKTITTLNTSKMKDANGNKGLTRKMSGIEYLAEKSNESNGGIMNISLDGVTKSIELPRVQIKPVQEEGAEPKYEYYIGENKVELTQKDIDERVKLEEKFAQQYTEALQKSVKDAFGSKVKVEDTNNGKDGKIQLKFTTNEGSELVINSSVGDALGIGDTATSYLNTSKTLGELMETDTDGNGLKGLAAVQEQDEDGNWVDKLDDKGNKLYDFWLNGEKIGTYTKNTKLSDIMSDINSNADAGVQVAYSKATQSFTFTAKETGADSRVELGDGTGKDLASAMFGLSVSGEDKVSEVFEGVDLGADGQSIYFKMPDGTAVSVNVKSDTTMDEIVQKLNDSPLGIEGYTFSYDKTTGKIVANAGETTLDVEVASKAHFEEVDGRKRLVVDEELEYKNASQVSYTKGQDAKFTVTINGETKDMVRSSNSVSIDGLTINMKDTFNSEASNSGYGFRVTPGSEAVTFQSNTDSDKLIDVIKEMVNDYNTMMTEIKSAYMTMPYRKSGGAFENYEPLTEDDLEGMSESAIARYEEKAKQGLLFGDQTLSSLYSKMNEAFSFSNKADVDTLKDMGITVSYNSSDGSQAITIDEEKLRAMLDSDPDRVANLFTKTDGIMSRMKTQLDNYAKTTGEPKGILIQQAGSPLSSLSLMNNNWQSEIDNYTSQIEKWQSRLESQVERYTSQFTRLEMLINQMNSQSSALAGLMGG